MEDEPSLHRHHSLERVNLLQWHLLSSFAVYDVLEEQAVQLKQKKTAKQKTETEQKEKQRISSELHPLRTQHLAAAVAADVEMLSLMKVTVAEPLKLCHYGTSEKLPIETL